jgi:starch-binding outer membrane protein, SusD/RagB family
MKKITILLISLIAVLSFQSCNKFLDLEPISQGIAVSNTTSDSIVYATGQEVQSALDGVYSDFRNEYFELDYYVNGDAQSDDAYAGADNPANFQIDDYNIDALNSNVSRDWAYLYSTISKANSVINNVMEVPDSTFTQDSRNQILGEASFIRAFMYFQAVQLWGGVPLQLGTVPTISAELLPEIYPLLYPARAPEDSIYMQIILDLEFALEYVLATQPNKGYVTTGACNAMLAKVYATVEPHDYNKVKDYCDAVINGGYSLMPNYEDLWNNTVENCAESIFEINYEGTSSSGNWGASMFNGMDWKKFNIPSNDLVNAFDAAQDEIRKNASIHWLDVTGKWADTHWPSANYPFLWKWRDYSSPSPQNYIFIRLADILLLKAEALNELGDVSGAADLVNQVRSRVNLPNTTAANQDDMRLAIENERRLELAFEGWRWYDLKRTHRAIPVINNAVDENGNKLYNITEQNLFWPIPQSEMDMNENLTQNEGY